MRQPRRSIFILLFGSMCACSTFGQVAGLLSTPDGKPAAGADVFINHTSCYSTTDEEGHFSLQDVPSGFHELVAFKGGFELYRQLMRVSAGQDYNLNLQLTPAGKPPKGKRSSAIEEAFNRAMLGTDGSMKYLEGTPVVPEARENKFRVPSGPVVIEYPAAGYRIIVFFSSSEFQDVSEAAYMYQDLPIPNFTQKLEVEKFRQVMFKGSLRHWLRSVVGGNASEEGFQVVDGATITVARDSMNALTRISFTSPLKLTYSGQVSTISYSKPIEVNSNGLLLNPGVIHLEGHMAAQGLAHQLPLDFRPVKDIEAEYTEAMRYYYEKVHVHIDKPYYYSGESLWMKAYINYYQRAFRDSLSKVLHVELLTPYNEAVVYRSLPIENGVAHGDFVLPGYLAPGEYYLRAYTNLQLNFGSERLFLKTIHVLDQKSAVKSDPTYKSPPDIGLAIQPGNDTYKVRDRITLNLQLDSGLKSAQLSIAVTDVGLAVPLRESTLPDNYDIALEKIPVIKDLTHRVEKGVGFQGEFLNDKGRGENALLTFFEFKTGEVFQVETEHDGKFVQSGLRLPDSTQYAWKADKAKAKPYGKITILPRKIPELKGVVSTKLELVQLGQSTGPVQASSGSRLLTPVEITNTRITSPVDAASSQDRPFGRPNYALSKNQLNVNTGNLLYSLVGKVPGLVVSPTQRMIYFKRSEGTSILNQGLPLVTVNDVPTGGDPYTTLETLDFNTIESIEFHNRINSMYGTQGAFGVIAVYTKSGGDPLLSRIDPTLQTIVLPGFSRTRMFSSPDYEKSPSTAPDYRSTLYWNPDVRTDTDGRATVSFFASDLSGMYRVVVEGVTEEGYPLRAETFVIVTERK